MRATIRNPLMFEINRLRFAAIRRSLRPLASWTPMEQPRDGYSLIIGCSVDLVPILRANLEMLLRQDRRDLAQVVLVFDRTAEHARDLVEPQLLRRFGDQLPLTFVYYTPLQDRVMRWYDWGWTYCWMNWVLGLTACNTRYALIHDLDAMLIRPSLLSDRISTTVADGAQFCGGFYYKGNGFTEEDRLLTTFEMVVDVQYLRRRFDPLDLFNRPGRWNGRRVMFDTLLWPQAFGDASARSLFSPIDPREMVHPSQMICQYMDVRRRQRYVAPANNNILMIAFFMELGGDADALRQQQQALDESDGRFVRCFGCDVDFRHFQPVHARWLTEQAHRLDLAVHGHVRPEIERYFRSIEALPRRRLGPDAETDASEIEPMPV